MRRINLASIALTVCLLGCTTEQLGEPVTVLTYGPVVGMWACCTPHAAGTLLPDKVVGTVLRAAEESHGWGEMLAPVNEEDVRLIPVSWPPGSTARLAGSEVVVLDAAGVVIARTGGRYTCWQDAQEHWHCEPSETADPLPTPPGPAFDIAAVKAAFRAECEAPTVLEDETCDLIDIDAMRAAGDNLFVPLTFPKMNAVRAQGICEEIAAAQDDLDGEPLGYRIVVTEGGNNKHLGVCQVP
jgi:hypothetical protein